MTFYGKESMQHYALFDWASKQLSGLVELGYELQSYSKSKSVYLRVINSNVSNETKKNVRDMLDILKDKIGFSRSFGDPIFSEYHLDKEDYSEVFFQFLGTYPAKNRSGCRKKRLSKQ